MARKSKRLELNEAIRRGQAKIAEGLKTGQMRSDQSKTQPELKDKKDTVPPSPKMPFESKGVFLTSKEKSAYYSSLSSQTKSRILLYAVSVVVLALGILFVLTVVKPNPSKSVQDQDMKAETEAGSTDQQQTGANRFNFFSRDKTETAEPQDAGEIQGAVASEMPQGDNVIWIQSIALDRKDELKPVMDFFYRKGIETEIIEDRTSNLAVLVTKDGFEQNPVKKGTEGYELLQRIKSLGSVYVQETQDTKFGQKPFQDVLGYKR